MDSGILNYLKFTYILNNSNSLRGIFFLQSYDFLLTNFYKLLPYFTDFCSKRTPKQLTKTIASEINFERQKDDKNQKNTFFINRMDSVIYCASKLPSISKLLSLTHHDYLPYEYDSVKLENDIYFQLIDLRYSDGIVEILKFRLFSYEHQSLFLQEFVEKCSKDYERHMSNKLGTNKYFFDMVIQTKTRSSLQNPLPSSYIMFTKHKFQTSRNFNNVFFEERDMIENHTKFFLERKDWYNLKGIPHTLGFMFHGIPGCGKTSTIKAIANEGKRHIINIQLSQIKSKEQLNHLFFNDEINVMDNGKTERFIIPVTERMYVIEDIDAMGDTVLKREWKKPETKKEIKMDDLGNIIEDEPNPIDLSFLLNLLDGTLESEGRILAITTNFPERIDKALIRPGRIDMIVNFKKCSNEILKQIVENFYDIEVEYPTLDDKNLDKKWTPAEVNQILFRNFKDHSKALKELVELTPEELCGIPN
jgi:hypothetical protein